MEIDESKLVKNAILQTLKYLELYEPKCVCEQCSFGYQYDEKSKLKCKQLRQKIEEEHKVWENKILFWKEKLKNAE